MKLKKWDSHGSIKWRIFSSLAIFTGVMLILLWVLQIIFLDCFYKTIKVRHIKNSAQTIAKNIDSADFSSLLETTARNSQMCIVVCNELGQVLYSEDAQPNCMIHRLSLMSRMLIYNVTQNNGGTYFESFVRGNLKVASNEMIPADEKSGRVDETESIVYAFLVRRQNGSTVMVMLNSTISPVNATVQTLRIQLIWVTGILLILALLLAFFLSRRISEPIIQINQSAKALAQGDYDPNFSTTGYREIAELGQTLNYAAGELSKVETLRRDLIANVSHDLRTPLTMIIGYSEVMRDLPKENTSENVQVIIDEANRLTTLVNDMLDLSQIQSGTQTLSRGIFNLTQSVRTILLRYNKLTDYHVSFNATEDVYVFADELKISQVVYNLVNNALTYTGADKTVCLYQNVQDARVKILVRDTGEGIPQDKLKDIWNRYYRVDKEHKRAQVGTGLGLSIVKTILDMHGGRYGVQSEDGKGSTFWFELDQVAEREEDLQK